MRAAKMHDTIKFLWAVLAQLGFNGRLKASVASLIVGVGNLLGVGAMKGAPRMLKERDAGVLIAEDFRDGGVCIIDFGIHIEDNVACVGENRNAMAEYFHILGLHVFYV